MHVPFVFRKLIPEIVWFSGRNNWRINGNFNDEVVDARLLVAGGSAAGWVHFKGNATSDNSIFRIALPSESPAIKYFADLYSDVSSGLQVDIKSLGGSTVVTIIIEYEEF